MLCVEELCSIFKNLHPHKRIELMCGLLQCCVPLELRFIGSYVENLGRRDFHYLREYEIKSNSSQEISKLFKANEDVIRHKLAVYLSLLHTSNSVCSKVCFDLLMLLNTYLIRAYVSPLTYTKLTLDVMLELLTVLVMGINHPAFTFEQRSRLFEIYRWLESRAECLLPAVSMGKQIQVPEAGPVDQRCMDNQPAEPLPNPVAERTVPESMPPPIYNTNLTPEKSNGDADGVEGQIFIGNAYFQYLLRSPLVEGLHSPLESAGSQNDNSLSPQGWPKPELGNSPNQADHRHLFQESAQKVFIKRVEVTGSRKTKRKQEFQLEVTWSNGETSQVYKSYQDLYDFHTRLVKFYPEDASVHRQDRKLPFLSGNPHLSAREDYVEQTSNTITNYFRKLVALENDILGCDIVLQFFNDTGSKSLAFSMSPSNRQSIPTSPNTSQDDADMTAGNYGSNSIIITRASPLRDRYAATSSSDYSPEKTSLVSRSPSPNQRQPLPLMQELSEPRKDSRSSSPQNSDWSSIVMPYQDDQSPLSKQLHSQELLKPPHDSCSSSPKHNHCLPTIEELLEELQLSHHKDTFNQFTITQLLNFQEEDFVLLKLSGHAQKRLKTKLKQLGSGKMLNGFRGDFQASSDQACSRPPQDTLYTSTASLGHLTSSDNGNSSRDSSPPVSPRQVKTMQAQRSHGSGPVSPRNSPISQGTVLISPPHSPELPASGTGSSHHSLISHGHGPLHSPKPNVTAPSSSHHSPIFQGSVDTNPHSPMSHGTGAASPQHSPITNVTGPENPHHSQMTQFPGVISTQNSPKAYVTGPENPHHSPMTQFPGVSTTQNSPKAHVTGPGSLDHSPKPNVTRATSPHQAQKPQIPSSTWSGTESGFPRQAKTHQSGNLEGSELMSQDQGKPNQKLSFDHTDHISAGPGKAAKCALPSNEENTESEPQVQSGHIYPTYEAMEPQSYRVQSLSDGLQLPNDRLQALEENKNKTETQEAGQPILLAPFQGPIQEVVPAAPLIVSALDPVTTEIDCVPPDLVSNKTSQNEEPREMPPNNNKPLDFSSHMYHTGFMPDPSTAYHTHLHFPRLFHQMYPMCAPQPAHLPIHRYNNLPRHPEHHLHNKKSAAKPYLQTHTDPMTNKVMTVTVNSAAYRTPFTDCPPSSSPVTPVTSPANLARSMTIVNTPGAAPHFAFHSSMASPMTYSNVNPAKTHHIKPVNGQSSNGDSATTSLENLNYGAAQHVNTTVVAPQYPPSQAQAVNFHSSCTSCGCRGRCGGSPNYSAAYGGYVHHQVNMPQVVHLPSFMSSNSNGLLPSPCLPPNCQLPFAVNSLPNGITSEQMSAHSFMSQTSGPAPNFLNRMFYEHNSTHSNTATDRNNKAKPPTCYNCGELGHEATDCKEASMQSSSGQYSLNFKPDYLD